MGIRNIKRTSGYGIPIVIACAVMIGFNLLAVAPDSSGFVPHAIIVVVGFGFLAVLLYIVFAFDLGGKAYPSNSDDAQ